MLSVQFEPRQKQFDQRQKKFWPTPKKFDQGQKIFDSRQKIFDQRQRILIHTKKILSYGKRHFDPHPFLTHAKKNWPTPKTNSPTPKNIWPTPKTIWPTPKNVDLRLKHFDQCTRKGMPPTLPTPPTLTHHPYFLVESKNECNSYKSLYVLPLISRLQKGLLKIRYKINFITVR